MSTGVYSTNNEMDNAVIGSSAYSIALLYTFDGASRTRVWRGRESRLFKNYPPTSRLNSAPQDWDTHIHSGLEHSINSHPLKLQRTQHNALQGTVKHVNFCFLSTCKNSYYCVCVGLCFMNERINAPVAYVKFVSTLWSGINRSNDSERLIMLFLCLGHTFIRPYVCFSSVCWFSDLVGVCLVGAGVAPIFTKHLTLTLTNQYLFVNKYLSILWEQFTVCWRTEV